MRLIGNGVRGQGWERDCDQCAAPFITACILANAPLRLLMCDSEPMTVKVWCGCRMDRLCSENAPQQYDLATQSAYASSSATGSARGCPVRPTARLVVDQ